MINEFLDQSGFIAEVIRTARTQTADIRVEEGVVSIVVPKDLPTERIQQLLADKRRWVLQKMALHKEARPINPKQFVSGEALPYLGRNYRLKVLKGPFQAAKLKQGQLLVTVPEGSEQPHMIRNAIIRWYRWQAERKLRDKTRRYARMLNVEPSDVGIKTFKSRWGSCSKHGRIDYNWKIVMAPNRQVDYVVLHELCHLKHHDHSPQFWQAMERVMPDYLEAKAWLKAFGHELEV